MANHKTPTELKNTEQILVRCSPKLKNAVDTMVKERFGENGTEQGSLATLVRGFLEEETMRWNASKSKKQAD